MIELNRGYNEDNIELLKRMPDGLLDIICIDPPYLYLKGQKLERPFDEQLFFSECKRVLKKDGFIILFGRGTSFYRWNTILDSLGFTFKEEIVWDKSSSSTPLTAMSRVHETVSIWCKGKAGINRVKVPYVEMKSHDIASIITDINRLKTTFNNTKSLEAILEYLENNDGRLKSAIRTDFSKTANISKHWITKSESAGAGNRCINVMNAVHNGMNEKTIIKQGRDHYNTIHPTQKPVRLLERLLALVKPKHDNIIAADFFAGSFSFAEACINMGINWICCEIDREYYEGGTERISKLIRTKELHPQQGKLAI